MLDDLAPIFSYAVEANASDVYLQPDSVPFFRIEGKLRRSEFMIVTSDNMTEVCSACLSAAQKQILDEVRTVDFSLEFLSRRWRGNIYFRRGEAVAVFRLVPEKIFTLAELGLDILRPLTKLKSGLVLVTGYVGSGKTTTLAALINELAAAGPKHIITLEDPVEYIYDVPGSLFSQREWGRDFFSFPQAISSALRQMPDALLVGEIRDRATVEAALLAAETGLLVLGTLHTPSAVETARRVEGMFAASDRESVRDQFAAVLGGIVSQRLIPAIPSGRVAAAELLLPNAAARNIIRQGRYLQLESVMLSGESDGMQTLGAALKRLRQNGRIDAKALAEASGQ